MKELELKIPLLQFLISLKECHFLTFLSRLNDYDEKEVIVVTLKDFEFGSVEIDTRIWNPVVSFYKNNTRFSVIIKDPREAYEAIVGYLNYIKSGKTI